MICLNCAVSPEELLLSDDGFYVTCPAGEKSRYSQCDNARHVTLYRFTKQTCAACRFAGVCHYVKPFSTDHLPVLLRRLTRSPLDLALLFENFDQHQIHGTAIVIAAEAVLPDEIRQVFRDTLTQRGDFVVTELLPAEDRIR